VNSKHQIYIQSPEVEAEEEIASRLLCVNTEAHASEELDVFIQCCVAERGNRARDKSVQAFLCDS
jgi:hypothetical protein